MNWREYDASLRQRGSLTVWFTDKAIEGWRAEPRTTPGGQPWYSSSAILTALTLRAVFRLALRQRMLRIRSKADQTSTLEPQSGVPGEGGVGCHRGRENAG